MKHKHKIKMIFLQVNGYISVYLSIMSILVRFTDSLAFTYLNEIINLLKQKYWYTNIKPIDYL